MVQTNRQARIIRKNLHGATEKERKETNNNNNNIKKEALGTNKQGRRQAHTHQICTQATRRTENLISSKETRPPVILKLSDITELSTTVRILKQFDPPMHNEARTTNGAPPRKRPSASNGPSVRKYKRRAHKANRPPIHIWPKIDQHQQPHI